MEQPSASGEKRKSKADQSTERNLKQGKKLKTPTSVGSKNPTKIENKINEFKKGVKDIGLEDFIKDPLVFCREKKLPITDVTKETEEEELRNSKPHELKKFTDMLDCIGNTMEIFNAKHSRFILKATLDQQEDRDNKRFKLTLENSENLRLRQTLFEIPIPDMDANKSKSLSHLLIGNYNLNKNTPFCKCNHHNMIQTVSRPNLNVEVTCYVVYGLFCNLENCERIVCVNSTAASSTIGMQIDYQLQVLANQTTPAKTDFKKHLLDCHHRACTKVDNLKKLFINNVIVVILSVSDNKHSIDRWRIFWQSILRSASKI